LSGALAVIELLTRCSTVTPRGLAGRCTGNGPHHQAAQLLAADPGGGAGDPK